MLRYEYGCDTGSEHGANTLSASYFLGNSFLVISYHEPWNCYGWLDRFISQRSEMQIYHLISSKGRGIKELLYPLSYIDRYLLQRQAQI